MEVILTITRYFYDGTATGVQSRNEIPVQIQFNLHEFDEILISMSCFQKSHFKNNYDDLNKVPGVKNFTLFDNDPEEDVPNSLKYGHRHMFKCMRPAKPLSDMPALVQWTVPDEKLLGGPVLRLVSTEFDGVEYLLETKSDLLRIHLVMDNLYVYSQDLIQRGAR